MWLMGTFAFMALLLAAIGVVALISIRRLDGLEEDRRDGISMPRAVLGRLLFDLPRGRHS